MGQRTVLLVNLSSFRVHEELHTRCEVRDKEKTEQAIRIKRKEESADVGPLNSSLEANGPLLSIYGGRKAIAVDIDAHTRAVQTSGTTGRARTSINLWAGHPQRTKCDRPKYTPSTSSIASFLYSRTTTATNKHTVCPIGALLFAINSRLSPLTFSPRTE